MEEKKRVRPTVAQVKGLEAELKNAMEHVSDMQEAVVFLQTKLDKLEAQKAEWTALKEKYEEQIEGTSSLVADCDAWREKYHALAKDCKALKRQAEDYETLKREKKASDKKKDSEIMNLRAVINDKDAELGNLRRRQKELEREAGRVREQYKAAEERHREARKEIQWLYARSLRQRIINAEYQG